MRAEIGEFECLREGRFKYTIRVDIIQIERMNLSFGGEEVINGHKLDV